MPNINHFHSTVYEKLNNTFSWPLQDINEPWYIIKCSYWLTISSILHELLQHRFLIFIQNYHFRTCSRVWHFQLEDMATLRFFVHRPLNFTLSSECFRHFDKLLIVTHDFKVMSPTDATNWQKPQIV